MIGFSTILRDILNFCMVNNLSLMLAKAFFCFSERPDFRVAFGITLSPSLGNPELM